MKNALLWSGKLLEICSTIALVAVLLGWQPDQRAVAIAAFLGWFGSASAKAELRELQDGHD